MSKKITILGLEFEIATPFAEGHVMTAGEAKHLNQVRGENIGNNVRKKIEALRSEDKTYTPEAEAEAAALVAEADANYEFSVASVGSGRKVVDPVEREAISIAKAQISLAAKKQGKAIKDIDKDRLAELIEQVSQRDDVRKAAAKRVKEREAAAGDLDLTF